MGRLLRRVVGDPVYPCISGKRLGCLCPSHVFALGEHSPFSPSRCQQFDAYRRPHVAAQQEHEKVDGRDLVPGDELGLSPAGCPPDRPAKRGNRDLGHCLANGLLLRFQVWPGRCVGLFIGSYSTAQSTSKACAAARPAPGSKS